MSRSAGRSRSFLACRAWSAVRGGRRIVGAVQAEFDAGQLGVAGRTGGITAPGQRIAQLRKTSVDGGVHARCRRRVLGDLVTRARQSAEAMGTRLLSPAEVRAKLNLQKRWG